MIELQCSGKYASLAKQLGITKSTIHAWFHDGRTPTVDISMRIAWFVDTNLESLLTGRLQEWQPSADAAPAQMPLPLDYPPRPQWNRRVRRHDWVLIEQQLQEILRQPMPVSLMHAASVMGIPSCMLYMQCNTTARKIAHRWLVYLQRRQHAKVVESWPLLEAACRRLLEEGITPNLRSVQELIPAEVLNRIYGVWDVLRDVCEHIQSSVHATSNLRGAPPPARYLVDKQ